jgi:hypothetical protein
MRRALIALLAAALTAAGLDAQDPPLALVLSRAAAYVADYQKRLQGIVAEELYLQNYTNTGRGRGRGIREGRRLRSDVLLVKLAGDEWWMQFRDVFEVDRRPIRDRDQRLYQLFVDAKADARAQAQTIQAESARYNLGPVTRTINIPIMALLFLEQGSQHRLDFRQGKAGNVKRFAELAAADDIWMIEFDEKGPGTMVKGANNRDIPSHGRIWLDRTTGRILRTELISQDMQLRAQVDVSYKVMPGIEVLVPGEMRENYTLRQTEVRIDGKATYDKFRQFSVSTTEKPKSNDF